MGQGLCCLLGTSSSMARVSMIFICSSHCYSSLLPGFGRVCSGHGPELNLVWLRMCFSPIPTAISFLSDNKVWARSAETSSKLSVSRPGHCPSQPVPKLNAASQTDLNPWQLEPVSNMFWWLQHIQKSHILAVASFPWLLLYFPASSSLSSGLGMASPPCISLQQA